MSPPFFQVTSLFLHLVPALVSWSLRWHPEQGVGAGAASAQRFSTTAASGAVSQGLLINEECHPSTVPPAAAAAAASFPGGGSLGGDGGLVGLVVVPMLLYLLWAALYYLQVSDGGLVGLVVVPMLLYLLWAALYYLQASETQTRQDESLYLSDPCHLQVSVSQ